MHHSILSTSDALYQNRLNRIKRCTYPISYAIVLPERNHYSVGRVSPMTNQWGDIRRRGHNRNNYPWQSTRKGRSNICLWCFSSYPKGHLQECASWWSLSCAKSFDVKMVEIGATIGIAIAIGGRARTSGSWWSVSLGFSRSKGHRKVWGKAPGLCRWLRLRSRARSRNTGCRKWLRRFHGVETRREFSWSQADSLGRHRSHCLLWN